MFSTLPRSSPNSHFLTFRIAIQLYSAMQLASNLFILCQSPAAAQKVGKAEAKIYLSRLPTKQELSKRNTRAKFEPAFGCYLGGYVQFDGTLKTVVRDSDGKSHRDPREFERAVGKPHSMYFFYVGYGHSPQPGWMSWLASQGKFLHIALEPNDGLEKVKDDKYLQGLADALAKTKAKIFLRFASEMNGNWSVYHDPKKFKEKFRLVQRVMKRRAPNVAMVWCPYAVPTRHIPEYYPGDDAVDWVGVNMYSVTYHDNDLKHPCETEHTSDLLATVYDRYANRKPFMICEFAATHYAACEKRPRPDFASLKISTLYSTLSRRFPRVKAINYFDSNNLQFTATANNDYSVTNNPTVLSCYKNAISSSYFLSSSLPDNRPQLPAPIPMPLRNGEVLKGTVELSCYARCPSDILTVRYVLDGRLLYSANSADKWVFHLNASLISPGKHRLTLLVINSNGVIAASQSVSVSVAIAKQVSIRRTGGSAQTLSHREHSNIVSRLNVMSLSRQSRRRKSGY